MKVIIVESNPLYLEKATRASGGVGNAEYYGLALQKCQPQVQFDVVRPYEGQAMPDLSQYDGAVFTGSGASWATCDVKAWPIQRAMEAIFKAGLPSLGSCNGLQLAVVILGGRTGASPNGLEIGLARDIRLTEAGKVHPLHAGRRPVFASPCVHRDEVRAVPNGAVVTATNDHSPVQGMVYERGGVKFWGMQYHPEVTPARFAPYIADPVSMFAGAQQMAEDMLVADAEPESDAARRLGAMADDLTPGVIHTELSNWLAMLQQQDK